MTSGFALAEACAQVCPPDGGTMLRGSSADPVPDSSVARGGRKRSLVAVLKP